MLQSSSTSILTLKRIGASNRNIGKISFLYSCLQREPHHFMTTRATENSLHSQSYVAKTSMLVGINIMSMILHVGLFHLHKLPCLNCLVSYFPETLDLAFKLKRKKFLIEVCLYTSGMCFFFFCTPMDLSA